MKDVVLNTSESLLEEDQNFIDSIINPDLLMVKGRKALLALDVANKIREKIYKKLIVK